MFDQVGIIVLALVSAITFSLDLYTLFDVATTNPGFMSKGSLTDDEFINLPEDKIKRNVKGIIIELKYCMTCKIIREPRSFHCNVCGNCVLVHG